MLINRPPSSWYLFVPALLLIILPVAIAFDFGGVLWWTHYVASLATSTIIICLLPSFLQKELPNSKAFLVLAPLICWCGFSYWQCTVLSTDWVATLSNATESAHREWAGDILARATPEGLDRQAELIPLSVDPESTKHYATLALLLIPYVASALLVFCRPEWAKWLLLITSGAVAFHVAYEFWCQLFPEHSIRGTPPGQIDLGFGSYVNRNNAALHLNLGLSTSLGLLAWRIASQRRLGLANDDFDVVDVVNLLASKLSIYALITTSLCFAGLFACGSRSGILACGVGLVVLASRFRIRRVGVFAAALLGICGLVAWLLVAPNNDATTLNRISEISLKTGAGISSDDRWSHWRDATRAAAAYAPTGSGLATYAYAYLPFQADGSEYWFHHADNLYLELFVEQGLVGCTLVIVMALMLMRALQRLGRSEEPVDVGLYVAMIFAGTATALSQVFDFGLALPSNLLFFALLASAAFARSVGMGQQVRCPVTLKLRLGVYLPAIMLLVAVAIHSAIGLYSDATLATRLQIAELEYQTNKHDRMRMRALAEKLAEQSTRSESADLYDLVSLAQFQAARLEELHQEDIQDLQAYAEAYAATSLTNRRLQSREQVGQSPEDRTSKRDGYEASLAWTMKSLEMRPLSLKPRSMIAYLDFIHQDAELTRRTLIQLAELQKRFPRQLLRIGKLSYESGFNELAAELFRTALELDPQQTTIAIELLKGAPQLSLLEVIPQRSVNQRLAASAILDRKLDGQKVAADADAFLRQSVSHFRCDELSSAHDRSHCLQILATMHFSLENHTEGLAALRDATEALPADYSTRITLVEKLRELQRYDDALAEARLGQSLFPSNSRFNALIDAMRDERIRRRDSEANPRPLSRPQN